MSLESDKKEIIAFLNLLQKKETEFVVYQTLFAGLNHAYPEDHLFDRFQDQVNSPLGWGVRQKYVPLVELVRQSADLTALAMELVKRVLASESYS